MVSEVIRKNGKVKVNLKLDRTVRQDFSTTTKNNGGSMQTVLEAFVNAYISNPKRFKIKMEVVDG